MPATHPSVKTTKAPGVPGPLRAFASNGYFSALLIETKLERQLGADAVHGGNDGNRDAGSNETVFDRGGARFILHETRKRDSSIR